MHLLHARLSICKMESDQESKKFGTFNAASHLNTFRDLKLFFQKANHLSFRKPGSFTCTQFAVADEEPNWFILQHV